MAQVIIVSNRLPVSVKKEDGVLSFSPSVGGLATGLSSYADAPGSVWIGWPGIPSDDLTEPEMREISRELRKHRCSPVFLSKKQIDDFYNGYSNGILWPLFHTLPYSLPAEHTRWWQAYRQVNRLFAEAVAEHARPTSRIWIHDYQLLLLPQLIRRDIPAANTGFFLHIPFPDNHSLAKLPEYKKLLRGMLGADLVGFHTPGYVQNFFDNCVACGLSVAGENQVVIENRMVRVGDFPMGIDYEKYSAAGKTEAVQARAREFERRYHGRKVIVAVDRLDPSKGLAERLIAYRDFLALYPKQHKKVVFSMVAAPSRTDIPAYQKLAKRLDTLVTDINATFGSPRWQPVDYMPQAQPFEVVTALFQIADVAFITPLKDGMNLVAKEFIASNQKNGVLILSETAGAATELRAALLVDPAKPATMVAALHEALAMPHIELGARLRKMQRYVSDHSVQAWAKSFVDTLQQPLPGTPELRTRSLVQRDLSRLTSEYEQSKKRLFLLDYDGSLVKFARDTTQAAPPRHLLSLLTRLCADRHNKVVVVSGRSSFDLDKWLGELPINLVAEHGAAVKPVGKKTWQTTERDERRWKRVVEPVLTRYAEQTPGAHVEVKQHSLVWHYRGASPYYAQKNVVIIKRILKPLLKSYGLEVFQGNKILEVKDPRVSKGTAIKKWLQKDHDFVLVIGDDFTDEDMFHVAPQTACTIKVGRGRTAAQYRLPDAAAVIRFLNQLAATK